MPDSSPRTERASQTRHRDLGAWAALAILLVPATVLPMLQLPYDREYALIGYSTSAPTDRVADLQRRIDRGESTLEFDAKSGYLASLLRELDIDIASQMLVFSKTSFQTGFIAPETPRAIYFNDDVYIASVQGGDVVEISSMDPDLGPVFYTLAQDEGVPPRFRRETGLCLRCHDSYALSGGGVPRHLMGSGLTDRSGQFVSHEGWYLTSDQTPLELRWGGWYVSGSHGDQLHRGNLVIEDPTDPSWFDMRRGANVTDLGSLVDTQPYLGDHSDIVALMVMEHQIHVQNLITRVNWETRVALEDPEQGPGSGTVPHETSKRIASISEPLVEAMLMVGQTPLTDRIEGVSSFSTRFVERGPWDTEGRSLRDVDLEHRLFRYPCSYLIYSDAFNALADPVKDYVYRRLGEILGGEDQGGGFAHLSNADRRAILEILEDTVPAIRQPAGG